MLGLEFGLDSREVRMIAETLGLGRWVNPRLFILDETEEKQVREAVDRIVADRRKRSANKGRSFATPAASA
jgi:hypothetical protein